MPQMDRATARALTEAGYMPLAEYLRRFAGEVEAVQPLPRLAVRRSRGWKVQAHFVGPARGYAVSYRRKQRAFG